MKTTDMDQVLNYWHSVEFFNAYDLDEHLNEARARRRRTEGVKHKDLTNGCWEELSAQRSILYLVPFDVSEVTRLVESHPAIQAQALPTTEQARDAEMAAEGLSCFAKLHLGSGGKPALEGISLSALPWALGRLQHGDLHDLSAESFEASIGWLKTELADVLSGEEERLSAEMLLKVTQSLRTWAGYSPPSEILAWMEILPSIPAKAAETPFITEASADGAPTEEPDEEEDLPILNSFYVHDLMQAKRELSGTRPPRALLAYLSDTDMPKLDLDSNAGQREILETLRPNHGIAGRWPSAPENIQSLMQQYALNKMKTMSVGEILAVNGPPGTGKTTLLRDLIAHVVVERAKILASFTSASDGLSGSVVDSIFEKNTYSIPVLAESLTGFEIVVASTNNGAVENLSLELPQCENIDVRRLDSLSYFRPLATKYAGSHSTKRWKEPKPVWGLISAALGKKANRTRFKDIFVYRALKPEDRPDKYLSIKQCAANWDKKGAMTFWHYHKQTATNRIDFVTAQRQFKQTLEAYDVAHSILDGLDRALEAVESSWPRLAKLFPDTPRFAVNDLPALTQRVARLAERAEEDAQLLLEQIGPPFLRWWAKWFRKHLYGRWMRAREHALFVKRMHDALIDLMPMIERCGVSLWDGSSLSSKANQSKAFWQGESLNKRRSDLFASAMQLHEAFFHEIHSRQPDLVRALSDMLSTPPLSSGRKVLWQWLFMLTPVISSTFASVRRQFAGLGTEDLGWLVIDEAGQAVPQAAVGAIMRAQRVVVVGDPLQIPPVVTQSTRLLAKLGNYWLKNRRARYAVDGHSVQTLADRCYPFGVRHPLDPGKFIGIPLVMHRRCDNPMFDIANRIAYDGRMKHAKESMPVGHDVLGLSAWWHIEGESLDGTKYIDAQGSILFDALVALYKKDAIERNYEMPKAFVITPFREVKRGLIDLVKSEERWKAALAGTDLLVPTQLDEWASKNVGTVHTFQGKESDIVFFVLGCDSTHTGAVDWASSAPNILNVAVTRAKKHLYILGDRTVWGEKNYFSEALAALDAIDARSSWLAEPALTSRDS